MPTCITRPFGALARIGALALACLLVMIAIAGCSGVGSNGVENVFDEIVLTSPTSANESIFGSVEAQTPTGFEQLAPSGTDPHAGEVVVYEYVGSDLGDPWEESGLGSVDDAGEDPREASLDATVRSESSKLDIVCWTPSRVAADGKEYYAGVELTYAVGDDGPALAEYYEQRGTDGNYSLLDRDEWLTATGMDGDALDSWAQHAIRDLYVAGYLDANVETTLFSMDDLGNGVSLEGDFLARMRES
ncbi:MAG: hypothetical protein ACOYIK_02110 [Coriobacteriales bacterium]